MFKNHLKIAWRNLTRNKQQTVINLLGLTVGTLCCLLILAHVNAQFGYDEHHDEAASLYRIRTKLKTINNNSIDSDMATASPPIAFAMKQDFPEVKEACRIVYFGEGSEQLLRVSGSTTSYYEKQGYLVDSTFFSLFKYRLLEGNGREALKAPNSIVLSATLAKKLFGNKASLNKTVILGDGEQQLDLTVTGVFKENEFKTHLRPNYLLSMSSPGLGDFVRSVENFATQNFVHSYVKLVPGTNPDNLDKKLVDFIDQRASEDLAAMGFDKKLLLQPVKDIHLYSKGIANQIEEVSNIEYLYAMLLLAMIIQLVACINFVNLSTAKASKRSKEIGVRKVVGARRGLLVRQFLTESVVLSLFSVLISVPLAILLLPVMSMLAGGDLVLSDVLNPKILSLLMGLGLFTGLLAGIYPALILSSIKPAMVLKGILNIPTGSGNLRRALVIFQFVVSIILVTAVIIVTQQLGYAKKKDMGFDKENLLAVRLGTDELRDNFGVMKESLGAVAGVLEVGGSNNYPSAPIMGDMGIHLPGQDENNLKAIFYNGITENYFKTVGTKLMLGRELRPNDSTQIIVNEATLDTFGIPMEDALATNLVQTYEGQSTVYEIVGVAQNYHFASLKSSIAPMLLFNDNYPNWLILRLGNRAYKELLTDLEQGWRSVSPHAPFAYTFIDKEVEKLYAEEKRLGQLSLVFTLLAILISCLGLFGLVSYEAEQKKKEIGIRKVLGASINSVIRLLTGDFVKLVGIAFLIASPIAYYCMQRWLEDFSYRIDIQWWVFALAGGTALIITLLTVGFQSLKSARVNPVESLRTE